MKKLLSIFTVGIILGPGIISSGAGIACRSSSKNNNNSSKKLDLNSLTAYDLDYDSKSFRTKGKIIINVPLAYELAEAQIMKEYDLFFNYKQKLAMTDFVHGLKPTTKQPWAIRIYDVDDESWILDKPENCVLKFNSPKYNVLKDNGLKVEINTLDKNVKSPHGTFRYCFKKFWYTNKNANKGHNITVERTKSAAKNNLSIDNVIDLTKGWDNPIPSFNLSARYLPPSPGWTIDNQWEHLAPRYKKEITSRFVTNLNFQLKTETQKLNTLKKVKIANNNVDVKNSQSFFNLSGGFYSVCGKTGYPEQIGGQFWSSVIGEDIYVQLDISNWTYLKNYVNPLPSSPAYAYLYLGRVTK